MRRGGVPDTKEIGFDDDAVDAVIDARDNAGEDTCEVVVNIDLDSKKLTSAGGLCGRV